MRKPCVFILTILTVWFVCGAKVIPLPDINKPNTISVNSEFLAIELLSIVVDEKN